MIANAVYRWRQDDHAPGEALHAGVRQALESVFRGAGQSRRVDEAYMEIRGQWAYLYSAVDRAGKTINFRLSAKRDVAARALFVKAIKLQGRAAATITVDSNAASCRAVQKMKTDESLPRRPNCDSRNI